MESKHVVCPLCGRRVLKYRFKAHYRSKSCIWAAERRIKEELETDDRPESIAASRTSSEIFYVFLEDARSYRRFRRERRKLDGLPVTWIGGLEKGFKGYELSYTATITQDELDGFSDLNPRIVEQILDRQLKNKADAIAANLLSNPRLDPGPRNGGWYDRGYRWCPRCWRWRRVDQLVDGVLCPECGKPVRGHPKRKRRGR